MARLPRYFAQDIPQHVILRGNNRQAIFLVESDYAQFKDFLLDASLRHELSIHAYVLMTNHIHLLATPGTAESLPKTMQSVGRRYVQQFNRCHERTGTLWEGRYRATVVDADDYLYECMRYIELNPVRAGIASHPRMYRWSSYRSNAEGKADSLVQPHPLYRSLGATDQERQLAYRGIVAESLTAENLAAVREATNKAWALGGTAFAERISLAANRRAVPGARGRKPRENTDSDPN